MDTFECIKTKLDVREFSAEDVPVEVRSKVHEAARLSGTGRYISSLTSLLCLHTHTNSIAQLKILYGKLSKLA
jgi:hypothetical protein